LIINFFFILVCEDGAMEKLTEEGTLINILL